MKGIKLFETIISSSFFFKAGGDERWATPTFLSRDRSQDPKQTKTNSRTYGLAGILPETIKSFLKGGIGCQEILKEEQ